MHARHLLSRSLDSQHAQQNFPIYLQHLEPLLNDADPTVRKHTPVILGALGAAQQPELRGFFAWLSDAAQRASSAPIDGATCSNIWGLLLLSAHECLQQLIHERVVEVAAPALPGLFGCLRWMLEHMSDASLLQQLLPLLSACSQPQLAPALAPHFAELVDQLLGWALDASSPQSVATEVNSCLMSVRSLWAANEALAVSIAQHLVDDLESLPEEPPPMLSHPEGARSGGGLQPMQHAPHLIRFVSCLNAIVGASGRGFASAQENASLVPRCLAVLAHRVPAEVLAASPPFTSASELLAVGSDCVLLLANIFRSRMAPHHQPAARVLFAPLALPGVSNATVVAVLEKHDILLRCHGSGLTAAAAQMLTSYISPLPRLWLSHPTPDVCASLLGTHRLLLCGRQTSSACASVLMQGLLAELRHLVAALPPTPAHPTSPAGVLAHATRAAEAGNGGANGGSKNGVAAEPPGPNDAGAGLIDGVAAGGGGGVSLAEASRLTHAHLSVCALVLAETTHCSHLLSVASTLLRHLHPVKTAAVASRPAVAVAVVVALLGVTYNRALVLPSPPGTGKPVHTSLCTLAAQLRQLINSMLAPARLAVADDSPLVRVAILKATTTAINAAATHRRAAASSAAASDSVLAAEPTAEVAAASESGRDSSFAVWLGDELLGASGGRDTSGQLSSLLTHTLTLTHAPAHATRHAALELIDSLLRTAPPTAWGGADLPRVLQVASAALGSEEMLCRGAARRLLAAAAPVALMALTPHAKVEVRAESGRGLGVGAAEPAGGVAAVVVTGNDGAAVSTATTGTSTSTASSNHSSQDHGSSFGDGHTSEWWRRRLLTSHGPSAYGPLQLQRTLKLLSGRVPADAAAHARIFVACAAAHSPPLRALLGIEPQLGAWWSVMEAARSLVNSRLRSPFGGPAQTFEGLDRMLSSALPAADKSAGNGNGSGPNGGGADASSLERLRLILSSLEQLERQVHSACDGSLALPPPPKATKLFFLNNKRVCFDWFARIRTKLLSAALATRQPASVVRHAQLRLVDLTHRASSMCIRHAASGRYDVQEGQLKSVQATLRDAEWTLFVLADAMLALGGKQALDGISAYAKRKLALVHAAAVRAQDKGEDEKPRLQVMQTPQQQEAAQQAAGPPPPLARGTWAPWLDGLRLRAAGRLEEAVTELRPLLGSANAALAAEASQASYVSCHITGCYVDLGDATQLQSWHGLLSTYRDAASEAAATPGTAAGARAASAASVDAFASPLSARARAVLGWLHQAPAELGEWSSVSAALSAANESLPPTGATVQPGGRVPHQWPWVNSPQLGGVEKLTSAFGVSGGADDKSEPGAAWQPFSDELELACGLGGGVTISALPILLHMQTMHTVTDASQDGNHARIGGERSAHGAWPALDAAAQLLDAHAPQLGAWLTLLAAEEHAHARSCAAAWGDAGGAASGSDVVGGKGVAGRGRGGRGGRGTGLVHHPASPPSVEPLHTSAPSHGPSLSATTSTPMAQSTGLIGLRLALAKLARRKGNAALAARLVGGVAESDAPWVGLRQRYEEILQLRATGRPAEALDALWTATQPLMRVVSSTSAPAPASAPAASAAAPAEESAMASAEARAAVVALAPPTDLELTRSKMLIKLSGWLTERPLVEQLRSGGASGGGASGGAHSALADALRAPEENGANGGGLSAEQLVNGAEEAGGECLRVATLQAPSHAKAHLRWGNWCYLQGAAALKSVGSSADGGGIEFSPEEKVQLRALVNEYLPPALAADSRTHDTLGALLSSHARLALDDGEKSEQHDADDASAVGAERELIQRFDEAFPAQCWGAGGVSEGDEPPPAGRTEAAATRLCALWRQVRRRLLAPLRTAAAAFFTHMRLCEEQRVPHAGVSVPLRLLRLLVRHSTELLTDFTSGFETTPPVAWRGVVPQLFARLAHPEPLVRARVQALLCAIGERMPELVLYPALVGADEPSGPLADGLAMVAPTPIDGSGATAGAASGGAPAAGRVERQAICATLRAHSPQLVDQLQLLIGELSRVTLLWEDHLSGVLASLQADVGTRIAKLREETRRVKANAKLTTADKHRILGEKYTAIMAPVIATLERQERALVASVPATPHEAAFQQGAGQLFARALAAFRAPTSVEGCWDPLREVQRQLAATLRTPTLELPRISPRLAALQTTLIPMPGLAADALLGARKASAAAAASVAPQDGPPGPSAVSADGAAAGERGVGALAEEYGGVCIERFGVELQLLPTKTRPKRLVLIGTDGREYVLSHPTIPYRAHSSVPAAVISLPPSAPPPCAHGTRAHHSHVAGTRTFSRAARTSTSTSASCSSCVSSTACFALTSTRGHTLPRAHATMRCCRSGRVQG